MIHYHGVPASSYANCAKFMCSRHALASFATVQGFMPVLAEVCQSFVLDNGAFTAWRSGEAVKDWGSCYEWYDEWLRHPACDWALIPDVIDGGEDDNDALVNTWPFQKGLGVPVWHYHESLERLERLASEWHRVAIGSSGEYAQIGTPAWWRRTDELMRAVCDSSGSPRVKLHGLRMLDPDIFSRLPLASADSCNAGRNCGRESKRLRLPVDAAAEVIIRRIEVSPGCARWRYKGVEQGSLFEGMVDT